MFKFKTKKKIKKDLKELIMMIAQADTGGALRHTTRRNKLLVIAAKSLTEEYGFFNYWK